MTLDEYNAIHNKATQDIPRRMYYDPQYSLGIMYFDPNPNAAYTCQIHSRKPLTSFSLISSTMDLPPEYAKALRFSLALDLAPEINVTLDKLTINKAHGAQNEIEELNSSAVRWVDFDDAITRPLRR
jgi:hypothetical protein